MPQRFLRPGIRHSERWNAVSWQAQSLWVRLMTIVDDFGRYNGRVSVIWAECYAVWNELNPTKSVNPQETAALLHELCEARLIEHYTADGKQVVQITQWQERIRNGAKERWPKNPNPQRIPADSCEILRNPASLVHPPSSTPAPSSPSSPKEGSGGEGPEASASVVGGNGGIGLEGLVGSLAAKKRPALATLPDREGVLRYLQSLENGSEAFTDSFYDAMVKQGWRDRLGKPIADWRKMAKEYAGKSLMNQRTA